MAPSSVATVASTTSPSCRYLGLFSACADKNAPQVDVTLGCDAVRGERGAHRGAGQHDVAGIELLELRQRLQGLHGRVEDVALDDHVLAHLAVDAQLQPQIAEALEFIGVQQHQRRPDRGERRIGLRFEELGFGQLHIARRDIVGDHQPDDELGQVGLGDLGAHRQLTADHQTDLQLVVQQLHMGGFDDVVERTNHRAGGLAEKGQRRLGGVAADVFDMRGVVGGLSDHAARRRDRGHQLKAVDRHGVGAVCGGVDGRTVGQHLGGGGRVGRDARGPRRGLHPPRVGGTQDRDGHNGSYLHSFGWVWGQELATLNSPRRADRSNSLS